MTSKIVADAHIPYVRDYFAPYGDLILRPGREIKANDLEDADILLVRSITHVDKHLLKNSSVKFVGSVTAGIDHIDTKFLVENGIEFYAALGFNAPPVADYVIAVIAALQKQQLIKSEKLKAAVIGVGHVGSMVVERLKRLNFDVTLCDPIRAQQESDFSSVPMEDIADVDLISLHVPLTLSGPFSTYHFINQSFMQRQKPGCIILNASRGAVLDSRDLLQDEKLIWCLDVFEHEPQIDAAVVNKALIATPHIAGYSVQSKLRGIDKIYRYACEHGIIPPGLISPLPMPTQRLSFAGANLGWRDIILGIFNPVLMTRVMREAMLSTDDFAPIFDEMRNKFNYRNEFNYTEICADVLKSDYLFLQQIGINLLASRD